MRVNMNKTKVMISGERQKPVQKAARWPCGVCGRGVGSNSIRVGLKTADRTADHRRTNRRPPQDSTERTAEHTAGRGK